MKRLIRLAEVERRTTHRKTEIYRLMRLGEFPRSVRVGPRNVAWVEEEIDAYVDSKIAQREAMEAQR